MVLADGIINNREGKGPGGRGFVDDVAVEIEALSSGIGGPFVSRIGRVLKPQHIDHRAGLPTFDCTDVISEWLTAAAADGLTAKIDAHDPGQYFMANRGADAGGALAYISGNLHVEADPRHRFFTGNLDGSPGGSELDNDFILLRPAALLAEPPDLTFRGLRFDQRRQKNSTSIPFPAPFYPVANPGASTTADAIAIRGALQDAEGVWRSGFGRVTIRGGKVRACNENQDFVQAGGDQAFFAEGVQSFDCQGVEFIGARDLAIYLARQFDSMSPMRTRIVGNIARKCMFAFSVKRSTEDSIISENFIEDCVSAILANIITGDGARRLSIEGNHIARCWQGVRLDWVEDGVIQANTIASLGFRHADGSMPHAAFAFPRGILFNGASHCEANLNYITGMSPGFETACHAFELRGYEGRASEYNTIALNKVRSIHRLGGEAETEADHNDFYRNRPVDCGLDYFLIYGPNSTQSNGPQADGVWTVGTSARRNTLALIDKNNLRFHSADGVPTFTGISGVAPTTGASVWTQNYLAADDGGNTRVWGQMTVRAPNTGAATTAGEFRFSAIAPGGSLVAALSVFYDRNLSRVPLEIASAASPGNPASGNWRIYTRSSDGALVARNSAGTEVVLAS